MFPLSSGHPLFSFPFHFPTRVSPSRFNSKGLFYSTMPFLVHCLPFLNVLMFYPYTFLLSTLKRLI